MKAVLFRRTGQNWQPSLRLWSAAAAIAVSLLTIAGITLYLSSSASTMHSFAGSFNQERQRAVATTLDGFRASTALTARDYAVWDETFAYAVSPDAEWSERNLDWLADSMGYSGALVLDRMGQVVYQRGVFEALSQQDRSLTVSHVADALKTQPAAEVLVYDHQSATLYWIAGSRIVHQDDSEQSGESAGGLLLALAIGPSELAHIEQVTGVTGVSVSLGGAAYMTPDHVGHIPGALPLPEVLGASGVEMIYDVNLPLVESQLRRLQTGTIYASALVLGTMLLSLLAIHAAAVRPAVELHEAVRAFAAGNEWRPPRAFFREFRLMAGALSQAIELRFQAQDKERQRAEELRLILDNLPAYVYLKDRHGHFVSVNRRLALAAGLDPEDVLGKSESLLSAPVFSQFSPDTDAQVIASGELLDREEQAVGGGNRLVLHVVRVPIFDKSGAVSGLVGMIFDLTERARLEESLRQAQKMQTIGQLAGGIAHDFNNLLTSIGGHARFALEGLPPGDQRSEDLEHVLKSADRAARLTRQLLDFARRRPVEFQVVNLNDLLQDADNMLRRLISEDTQLVIAPAAGLRAVRADLSQLEQVIVNLAVNARDAMPDGGKLVLETANAVLDEEYCRQHPEATPGPYVMLAVSDTGTGMTEEIKAHLFEPFFTTKETGQGTGLGLATVYGIVKQHHGHVFVYSEVGHGTCVKVYLPCEGVGAPMLPEGEEPLQAPLARGETVLVAEDEPAVRRVTARILRELGYTVIEAGDGEEALRLLQDDGNSPGLLITDVVMPRLGGAALAAQASAIQPDLRVLYVSGYTERGVADRHRLSADVPLLEKPFSREQLAQRVREVLDAPRIGCLP